MTRKLGSSLQTLTECMASGLFWNTVTPLLRTALTRMMEGDPFHKFRLVGGTSLSLQLGHRISVDIDLFTDATYGSINFGAIDSFLRDSFTYVSEPHPRVIGMGQSYLFGESEEDTVKLDLYYTDPFIQPPLVHDQLRLATVEEIIAMKVDIVQRVARKKDFWDLHELLEHYSPGKMIELHRAKYPYSHDEGLIRRNFTNFTTADEDFEPICLKGKYWELIKYDLIQASQRP